MSRNFDITLHHQRPMQMVHTPTRLKQRHHFHRFKPCISLLRRRQINDLLNLFHCQQSKLLRLLDFDFTIAWLKINKGIVVG
jgi:hypothetical protein